MGHLVARCKSSAHNLTRLQKHSLLSMARLNGARSQIRQKCAKLSCTSNLSIQLASPLGFLEFYCDIDLTNEEYVRQWSVNDH